MFHTQEDRRPDVFIKTFYFIEQNKKKYLLLLLSSTAADLAIGNAGIVLTGCFLKIIT